MLQQSSDMDPDPQLYKTGYFRKWHYTPSCTSAVWSCRAAMWKAIHPMNDILALLSIESCTYFTCIFLVWLNGRGESWNYYHIYLLWHCSGSCGFSGHVFNVYALYLTLINAVPLSVSYTPETTVKSHATHFWFPLNVQGPKGSGFASSGLRLWAGAGRQMR